MNKKIIISGGTGFLGRRLMIAFHRDGYDVHIITRYPEAARKICPEAKSCIKLSVNNIDEIADAVSGAAAVINLAGTSIDVRRWTKKYESLILNSRLAATRHVVEAIVKSNEKPNCLISASGVGFYGNGNDAILNETSLQGEGILVNVCRLWEAEALKADKHTRAICLRTGLVFDKSEGVLPRLILPYKFYLGGPIGTGNQWLSWIHIKDYIRLVQFIINNDEMSGTVNTASPNPVTMNQFSKITGNILHKPSFFRVPAFPLKLMFGKVAEELFLFSQRVVPQKAMENGFEFEFPSLMEALEDLIS